MTFSGIITALVTPFLEGRLDKGSFLRLLKEQVHEGVNQFVLASTTGESPTLEAEEVKTLCQWFQDFKEENKLSLKLILATGSFSTKESVEKTKKAVDKGANAVLVVTPYYNRPSQKGLLRHFEEVARASELPLLLYNVPSRTACSLEVKTIKTLSQVENIVGIKEATGDMEFFIKIKENCPKDFSLLSGDDPSSLEFFQLGGHGAISAGANILARKLINVFKDPEGKSEEFEKYREFFKELFRETNPVGLKQILSEKGIIASSELRLPLVAIENPRLPEAFRKLNK